MRAWRRFSALNSQDRRLVVRAAMLLAFTRVGLWVLPFATVRSLLDRYARAVAAPRIPPAGDTATRTGWAVAAVARRGPGMTCLVQALVADSLLRRAGLQPQLRIGVRGRPEPAARRFESHAWVECEGRVVVGDTDGLTGYGVLSAPGRP